MFNEEPNTPATSTIETGNIIAKRKKPYTILYVDDEEHNLRVFRSSFRKYYDVRVTADPLQAIDIVNNEKVHLLVTDQKMPKMTGTQLIEALLEIHPGLMSIIITGFSDIADITDAINKCGIHKYITKPWDQGELKMALDQALELYVLKNEKEALLEELREANENLEDMVYERTQKLQVVNTRLTESLRYALSIQSSLLPNSSELKHFFKEHFILYKPMDIVSGDFFYFTYTDRKLVLAAFDCTGHGVPGALLSIIGYTSLESIIGEKRITDSVIILKLLNDYITNHLKNEYPDKERRDGMDGSILVFDFEANTVDFAGAKGDMIYFKDGELEHLKGNKFSLGSTDKKNVGAISNEIVSLEGVTEIYLSSDGYRDQLSEDSTRKITYKKYKSLLTEIHDKPASEQEEILKSYLESFKGENSQTDDIMVMGLKL
jgi:CheY-like chemotaxis protein